MIILIFLIGLYLYFCFRLENSPHRDAIDEEIRQRYRVMK